MTHSPLLTFTKSGLQYITTASIIENKIVVVFAVIGAFTCPHSPIQLLVYNEYAPTL
jgi:peroxiredoxin